MDEYHDKMRKITKIFVEIMDKLVMNFLESRYDIPEDLVVDLFYNTYIRYNRLTTQNTMVKIQSLPERSCIDYNSYIRKHDSDCLFMRSNQNPLLDKHDYKYPLKNIKSSIDLIKAIHMTILNDKFFDAIMKILEVVTSLHRQYILLVGCIHQLNIGFSNIIRTGANLVALHRNKEGLANDVIKAMKDVILKERHELMETFIQDMGKQMVSLKVYNATLEVSADHFIMYWNNVAESTSDYMTFSEISFLTKESLRRATGDGERYENFKLMIVTIRILLHRIERSEDIDNPPFTPRIPTTRMYKWFILLKFVSVWLLKQLKITDVNKSILSVYGKDFGDDINAIELFNLNYSSHESIKLLLLGAITIVQPYE
jgi:hypothetical protein